MLSRTDIEKYFHGEKKGSWLFILIGLSGIAVSVIFFFLLHSALYRGMAVPLLSLGLVSALVGFTIYARSDKQMLDILAAYERNPRKLREKEFPRMEKVMRSFKLYRLIEVGLLVAGAGLYIYFIRDFRHDFWRGFGFALALMAIVLLVADYTAEKRSYLYKKVLEEFVNQQ